MKKFLQELSLKQEEYTIYCDSRSVIYLSKNSTYHSKSKYIDVRYHWIRDVLVIKELQLENVHTNENETYILTKYLPKEKLEVCRRRAGLVQPTI